MHATPMAPTAPSTVAPDDLPTTPLGPAVADEEGEGAHVDIPSERDTPPRASALGSLPGKDTSRRDTPQCTVTQEVVGWILLGAAMLILLGLLLGWAWTTQALQPKLDKQAQERRKLNEEWLAIRTARRQRSECPRCASPLSDKDWYYAPTLVEDPPDDD